MSKERKREGDPPERSDAADEDRPTVAPPFDPAELAAMSARPSPPGGTPAPAEGQPPPRKTPLGLAAPAAGRPMPNKTPLGLGAVRPPSPTLTDPEELEEARRRSMASSPVQRKVTPVGALSLANVHAPSNIPPAPSAPSGAGAPKKKDSITSLNAVDDEWDDLATTPPPPDQQAIIDASARDEEPPRPAAATAPEREAPPVTPRVASEPPAGPVTAPPPSPPAAPTPPPITEEEMHDRVAVGDYTGALAIASQLLEKDPGNAKVEACAKECRGVLEKMYKARLGALDRVPVVMVARDQLRWLSIDHRAGFVLSLIDGVSSLEMILDVTGMPQLDALRILAELAQQRIISLR